MKLELRGVTKRFGDFVANDGIDLTVEPGQIHCLLGENGAGKSTLMNVLYGLLRPDEGEILVDDEPVSFGGPDDAIAAGIGMVHQHFMLIPVFTVAENLVLGQETSRAGLLDLDEARSKVRELAGRFGFDIDPDKLVEQISVGVQQRVEIIKALSRDAQVVILDEPTAVLTPQETDELMAIMRQLRDAGTSIVFISHKLREVRAVADTITVIRRGRVVGTASPGASEAELAALMVGRDVVLQVEKAEREPGELALRVRDLRLVDPAGHVLLDDVGFDLLRGEILAVAGVQGNGQTELAEALLGLRSGLSGSIALDGTELVGCSTRQILDAGVGYIPEDRTHDGIIASLSIAENLVLDLHHRPPFASGFTLRPEEITANAAERIAEFDVRTPSISSTAGTLSGGNQQKVVVARELSRPLTMLMAAQPTRGLDVGSIEFVHRRLVAERNQGGAVLMVSTELDEVMALADRVAVMYRGRLVGIVPSDVPRGVLGLMMAGYPLDEAIARAEDGAAGGAGPGGAPNDAWGANGGVDGDAELGASGD